MAYPIVSGAAVLGLCGERPGEILGLRYSRMAGVSVRFALDDGETLTMLDEDLPEVYEVLWRLAPRPGAVSLAAVVRDLSRPSGRYGPPIDLTAAQSAALREAVKLLHSERSEPC